MNASEHVAMVESALRSNGYSPETVERASYRGCSMPPHPITRVTKGEFKGFAAEVGEPESLEHLRKIQAIQDLIPHVAKIHEIVERIVITGAAPGTLLWGLETAPNHVQSVLSCLHAIRVALLHVGLVHADIRPWNIMFDQAPGHATLFDWGYSFFINEKPFGNLDAHLAGRGFDRSIGHEITRQDIDNCIAMLETRKSPEEIWNHGVNEFSWRPTWCKRFEPPPNILRNNQTLIPGQEIRSKNGKYRLVYQADGNLVVYDDSQDKRPVWHSATHGRPAGRFVMQADGNAVIYPSTGPGIWHTGTHGRGNAWLSLEENGVLAIHTPVGKIWDFTMGGLLLRR
jgi:Phosphotransferase enzyme family